MTHDDHEAFASLYALRVRVLLRSGREQEHGPFPLGSPALSRTAEGGSGNTVGRQRRGSGTSRRRSTYSPVPTAAPRPRSAWSAA